MRKSLLIFLCAPLGIAFIGFVALWHAGFVGSTIDRIQADHSIKLPTSASEISCTGFISTRFVDSTEQASFILPKDDLASFVSQIQSLPQWGNVDNAFSGILLIPSSWKSAPVISQYTRQSLDGNLLVAKIFDIGHSKAGVTLATSWN